MHVIRILAAALAMICLAAAGWFGTLYAIPYRATDDIWSGMAARGIDHNVLTPAALTQAGKDPVPLANPDIVGRRAIYDLARGPVMFEANVPQNLAYWSVTVFAHNSDTVFVANDQATGPGTFRLIIRGADQQSAEPANMQVVSPSRLGFVLVRAVMRDRSDAADVQRTMTAVSDERLVALKDVAKR